MEQIDGLGSARRAGRAGDDVHLLVSFSFCRLPTLCSSTLPLHPAPLPTHLCSGYHGGALSRPISLQKRCLALLLAATPPAAISFLLVRQRDRPVPSPEARSPATSFRTISFSAEARTILSLRLLQALVRLAGVPPPARAATAGSNAVVVPLERGRCDPKPRRRTRRRRPSKRTVLSWNASLRSTSSMRCR